MAIVNITTQSDADFVRGFIYQQQPSNAPIDLTGNTMRMGIRKRAADATEVMLLTTENGGITITDPTNGKFTVWFKQEDLERLATEDYVHSLVRIKGSMTLLVWNGTLTHRDGPSR